MSNEKKSVISAREITGVVAKLNKRLNRSAAVRSEKRAHEMPLKSVVLKPAPAKHCRSVSRQQTRISGQGLYTFSLKVTDEGGRSLRGVLSAFASSRTQAIEFVYARMAEMRLRANSFALLRYAPSEWPLTSEKIVGMKQLFNSSSKIRPLYQLQDAA